MKQIKDPIHGYIKIEDDYVSNIVDTSLFQRLRYLKQLGTTYMVYPSANHSRFEHTLGVFHLGKQAFQSLVDNPSFTDGLASKDRQIPEMRETLKCACLFHDIGHLPFSHVCEPLLEEDIKEGKEDLVARLDKQGLVERLDPVWPEERLREEASPHELISCYIVLSEYQNTIKDIGIDHSDVTIDPYEVCAYILGTSIRAEEEGMWQPRAVSQLIHSAIDVDRLDFMLRDNFMAGASEVSLDSERMVDAYMTVGDSLTFSDKALSTVKNFLDGRISIYMWINQHHKVVYSDALMEKMATLLKDAVADEDNPFTVDKIVNMHINDHYVMEKLRKYAIEEEEEPLKQLYTNFMKRDFLASCWKHVLDYHQSIDDEAVRNYISEEVKGGAQRGNSIEEMLRNELGLEEHEVITTKSLNPEYGKELKEIYVDFGGTRKSITSFGLYKPRDEFITDIPYVYVPHDDREEAVSLLEAMDTH